MTRVLATIASCLLLAGCASTPVVHEDHDPEVNFDSLSSYAWREEPQTHSPLVRQRLVAAIDAQLQGKGWRKVAEDEAGTVLAVHVATHEEQTIDTFYSDPAWGGWSWYGVQGPRGGYASTRVTTYTIGTLVIDMFDTRTQRAIWRATAEGSVPETPEKINAAIDATIPRMFVNFPPRRTD
ncbi:DUF4136 domain-containing protein [Lysobacter sp. A6]|uniref:DUF4136 domain-containing protein n=1 Tax=Noviluteimonas lactosilytica TaxID=2888523 RepID=A0ABS8JMG4_9GAMM|nr:DUF4136 domain-containing protein [Lysobacter lactosilyticus]MCC8364674.1 DUF4136 domain-containing protein [Lysobacter lactosilyticus]